MGGYRKGSEWRRWDLHLHTPSSYDYGDKSVTNDDIINELCEAGVSVVAITDHHLMDITRIQNLQELGEKKDITILPGIEFLSDARGDQPVHMIGVFSEGCNLEHVWGQIENKTAISKIKGEGKQHNEVYCDLEDTISLIHELGGIITIHSGQKHGSVETITNSLSHTMAQKTDIASIVDIYELGKEEDQKGYIEKVFPYIKKRLPMIICSDNHNIRKYHVKENCWIKADPTFEGLKQIIYEPEERVYIGEIPPILSKVENNKTNYLKSLEIGQASATHSGDTWFNNISIEFNKELVAIIGNKGSGKSGVADILGLVGDTHTDKKYFSFLNRSKFLKGKLADKFQAQITWESAGKSDEVLLSADLKAEQPESVRFIPQNYFEELTNEIEISKFQHVLENIIFGYIPDAEKLEKSSFDELERYKAENVNRDIQTLKNSIQDINNEIIELEKKKHPDYIKKTNGLIGKKEIEIEEQKKLLEELPEINNPNEGEKDSGQQNNIITQHDLELDDLKKTLKEKETEKSSITRRVEALKQFKRKIEQQKYTLDEFLQHNLEEAKGYDLDIGKILKVEADYSSIDNLITGADEELNRVNVYFETFESIIAKGVQSGNESLVYKIKILTDQLKVETDKLTGKEKAFQKNEQRKKEITEIVQQLTGDDQNPETETLNYYLKEKEFIEDGLISQLEVMRSSRVDKSLEIFKKKNEIIELYNSFKKSVDDKISQNQDLLKEYDIKIDSSFNLNAGFYIDFLGYINQRRSGCFLGAEKGEDKIKAIIEDYGFSNEIEIKGLLRSIIDILEENNAVISEQVNKEKLSAFYDYVFSLDYIKPKYELKLGGKILSQLSPGERGALLLIFYLMIDKEEIPLIIDQPEDNLDNESVYNMLSNFIKQAKKKRQIIMVTHNPNLAVGADAEQIIYVNIDKMNKNEFSFISGSIENPEINAKIVQILEGTKPAFDKRKLKYQKIS